jgi:hypothetical protein
LVIAVAEIESSSITALVEGVNIGIRRADDGWAVCEGPCGTAGRTNPLLRMRMPVSTR